jgi:hypothetical protein
MCSIPKYFRDRNILLYNSKIVDKEEILRAVSITSTYRSSDKVGTVYVLQYIATYSLVHATNMTGSNSDDSIY